MANFCTQCGAKLTPAQRFCTECGAKIFNEEETAAAAQVVSEKVPETTAAETAPEASAEAVAETAAEEKAEEIIEAPVETVTEEKAEEFVETPVETVTEEKTEEVIEAPAETAEETAETVDEAEAEAENNDTENNNTEETPETADSGQTAADTVIAVSGKGESAIGQLGDPTAYMNAKFPDSLVNALKAFGSGIGNAFKDPKIIITVAVILMAQLFVRVLQFFNLGGKFTYFLSVLTFSRFGMGRTIFGRIGGVFGECVLITAVVSLFGSGINDTVLGCKSLFKKGEKRNAPAVFFGVTAASLLVVFFVGHENLTKILCALASLLIVLGITGKKQGVIFDLIASLMPKRSESVLNGFMTGMCIGCAASVVYCLVGFGYGAVFLSLGVMLAGIIMLIINSMKKGGDSP
ncbi:MAG: zinc ribbon domain-containing protein [Firmicutes bacterium]|nr:zinc ribbon domain-containing protein [Bacillota bacterium]